VEHSGWAVCGRRRLTLAVRHQKMRSTKPIIKSDALASLRPLFEEGGFLGTLGQIFQVNLIVDANVIIADLRWLVLKRKNPDARPQLLEVLQAQTIKAFAPTFLHDELRTNIPLLAAKENLPLEELEAHWETYKALISFFDVGGPEEGQQDPKDVPYLRLQTEIDALIVSNDSDIQQMGGRVVNVTLIAQLCTYSREAAIEYTLKMGGVLTIRISSTLLIVTSQFVRSLVPHVKKIPQWVWLLCLAMIAAGMAHPTTRIWIQNSLGSLSERSKKLGMVLFNHISPLILEHERAKQAALETLSDIKKNNCHL